MKTFECSIPYFEKGELLTKYIIALTRSKARYAFWKKLQDCLKPYKECYNAIKVRTIGKVRPEHLYGSIGQFDRIIKQRGIEFTYLGMKIDVAGEKGIIVGGNDSANLDVLFEGKTYPENCHPTWETTYYGKDDSIIKDFKTNK